ncbi:phage head morphogenesis protein [Arthrobacter sp. AQ5-05]|uniref:phage minor head protein n=1 Tax=Arthrobacter sp. AQ5-05 TaxID=2184581 RepID=UPI000DCAF387|nr:phage minor head protein [Arthrobacter sp. AQ5-05]RAX51283.1 phage head morphogenesis protein [Arthrobacter sp. AQ5-05]
MAITDETLLIAADTKRRLRAMSDEQIVVITRAWVDAWDSLGPEFHEALLEVIGDGKTRVPYAKVAKAKRLKDALRQARTTLDELAAQTRVTVTNDLASAVLDAADTHLAVARSQMPPAAAGVAVNFDAVSKTALDGIVLRSTEQIHASSLPIPADVERMMKRELVRAIAVGDNPRTTARRILRGAEGEFNGGLTRAATIARTELLDAHRQGALTAAQQNKDLLTGWVWSASLDARTCPSCLSNHGSFHPVDEFGPIDHHQGRCARVDKTLSWKELGFDGIEEPEDATPDARAWFDNLTDDSQDQIMGKAKAQMLRDGEIGWDDLTRRVETPGWRDSMTNVPVKDLRPVGQ